MNYKDCYLSEIYSAIQGEGPLVGVRQLFIRLSVCDLRCKWCDTPDSLIRSEFCNIENTSGQRDFYKIPNPINFTQVVDLIEKLNVIEHHSISFTGGEPLLQVDFLQYCLPKIKERIKTKIYLESGGHRPNELKKIIDFIDYISMDFKLPSSADTGFLWDKHKEFLEISLNANKNTWIKIVLTKETTFEELVKSIEIVKALNTNYKNNVEIFLQPVTKINGIAPPEEISLLNIQSELLKIYPHIRVIPQVHKLIDQM